MITNMMDIHNAFIQAFENAVIVDGSPVSVRFFNPQPKLKQKPVYPSIVVQPFQPREMNRVWVSSTFRRDDAGNIHELRPPIRFAFPYQVSLYADRFDHLTALFYGVYRVFPEKKGQRFITIGQDKFDVAVVDVRDMPSLDAGTFETVMTFEVYAPVFMVPETVAGAAITQYEINITPE
jgi:hypothetical protein